MTRDLLSLLAGDLLDEDVQLTLSELSRICEVSPERVIELVQEGIVEPLGREPNHWRFQGLSIRRVRCAVRLERDLGINAPGAALALDLLEELEILRSRLRRLG